jgi:hypothetical protein
VGRLFTGLALALVASLALNAAFLLQHAGGRDRPPVHPLRPVASLRGLLGSRLWSVGLAVGLSGWALHVAALSRAPLSLVQAFAGGGIALAAPVGTRALGQRLTRRERHGVALVALALVALSLGARQGGGRPPSALAMLPYLAVCGGLAALLAAAPSARRPAALGAAGGLLYGAGDAATKAVTAVAAGGGVGAALLSPWLAAVLLAAAGAFFCFQRGLQTGTAVPVIALMTAATNVSAVAGGVLVFGDPLGATPALAAVHLVAFVAVALAAPMLAPAQVRVVEAPPARGPEPPLKAIRAH